MARIKNNVQWLKGWSEDGIVGIADGNTNWSTDPEHHKYLYIFFEPIILFLGIEPKEVNKITSKGLWTMKFILWLYSRHSLSNLHPADELSIPNVIFTDETQDLAAGRPLPGGSAQFCSYHLCCMTTKSQWLFLNLFMPVVLILVTT